MKHFSFSIECEKKTITCLFTTKPIETATKGNLGNNNNNKKYHTQFKGKMIVTGRQRNKILVNKKYFYNAPSKHAKNPKQNTPPQKKLTAGCNTFTLQHRSKILLLSRVFKILLPMYIVMKKKKKHTYVQS